MAKVVSRVALDMHPYGNQMNFADLLDGRDAKFTSKMIRLDYKKAHERDVFYGSFSANSYSKTISGTGREWEHRKNGRLQWEITSASISAAAVLKAAKTSTLRDDKAIILKTFAKADTIIGSSYADWLLGFEGNDTIEGRGGVDSIDGGAGRDRVSFASSDRTIELALNGSSSSYAYVSGAKSDRIVNVEEAAGGSASDKLTGDKLANVLIGNGGDDSLDGGSGNDSLYGNAGNDSLSGGAGRDKLVGGSGNDTLLGGSSGDTLAGDSGNDLLSGGTANDKLSGGSGSDSLDGGSGNDTIDGGSGNDTIVGGTGKDYLAGGADADVFRFARTADSGPGATSRDVVTDFRHKLDKIDLSAIDAITSIPDALDDAFVLDARGTSSSAVAEGHIGWYVVNKRGTANDHTYIRINNDADAAIDMTIDLKGAIRLGAVDFIL